MNWCCLCASCCKYIGHSLTCSNCNISAIFCISCNFSALHFVIDRQPCYSISDASAVTIATDYACVPFQCRQKLIEHKLEDTLIVVWCACNTRAFAWHKTLHCALLQSPILVLPITAKPFVIKINHLSKPFVININHLSKPFVIKINHLSSK